MVRGGAWREEGTEECRRCEEEGVSVGCCASRMGGVVQIPKIKRYTATMTLCLYLPSISLRSNKGYAHPSYTPICGQNCPIAPRMMNTATTRLTMRLCEVSACGRQLRSCPSSFPARTRSPRSPWWAARYVVVGQGLAGRVVFRGRCGLGSSFRSECGLLDGCGRARASQASGKLERKTSRAQNLNCHSQPASHTTSSPRPGRHTSSPYKTY